MPDEEPDAFTVTPWQVTGQVDYAKLMRDFGTEPLGPELLERLRVAAGGELHPLIRRGFFFSHRDLAWALDEHARGNPFFLYTGRGPSGPVHLGHMVSWILTRWFQERFGCEVFFQLTDDEKFLFKEDLTLEETKKWAIENALDFLALGFEPGKTWIILDTEDAGVLYPQAIRVAKRITYSTARAVFGFKPEDNVGEVFFTSMQAVPAFLPSVLDGRARPCLIPHGIDQDPHFRVARDVLPKLGYHKPAAIHSKFVPGLASAGEGKMSASDESSAIYTHDPPKKVREKVMKHAFSGGRTTVEEHRRLGGDPDVDASYRWLTILEPSDARLADLAARYRSGELLSGEMKQAFVDVANAFLEAHRARKEALRPRLGEFRLAARRQRASGGER